MGLVNMKKVLQSRLASKDLDCTITFTDEGNLYITRQNGSQLKITDILSGYINLTDLETKDPALKNKLYLTNDNKLYVYDGVNYVTISGTSDSLDHTKIKNRELPNQHPISSISNLNTELASLATKIDDIRFRGFYSTYMDFPTSVSMNRNGDIAVTLIDGEFILYAYNSTSYTWEQIKSGGTGTGKKYENVRQPIVTDDNSKGYENGDIWIDTTSKSGYVCIDNSRGKATWKLITLEDLTPFTTKDLKEAGDKFFVSSADKNNLLQLSSIVSTQTSIQNQINTINRVIPTDANSSNKLVSTNTVNDKVKNIKFEDLLNTPSTLTANAFLTVDTSGTRITYKPDVDIKRYIDKITDKNGNSFHKVNSLSFTNLQGDIQLDGSLKLTSKMLSTELLDMPTSHEADKILVSSPETLSYKLKSIDELSLLSENFNENVEDTSTNWLENTTTGDYGYIIRHGLDSINIIAMFYDLDDIKIDLPYRILNNMEIMIISSTPVSFRAVINCSQGTSSEQLNNITKPPITASDFIDDINVRSDKTYSSKKIVELTKDFTKKSDVYTKIESNSIFASKSLEHNHANMVTLNDLEEDANGELTYKGNKLMTKVEAFHYEDHWVNVSNTTLEQVIEIRDIYNIQGYSTIINSEFTVKNLKPSVDEKTDKMNTLNLVVLDDSIKVLDVEIMPQDVQKYLLGISPNLKVFIRGDFSANFYIGAF